MSPLPRPVRAFFFGRTQLETLATPPSFFDNLQKIEKRRPPIYPSVPPGPHPQEGKAPSASLPPATVWLERRRTGPLMDGPDAAFPAAQNLTSQNGLL